VTARGRARGDGGGRGKEPVMDDASPPQVVGCVEYADGRKVRDVPLADVSEVLVDCDEHRFVWIGLYEPDAPLLRRVQEEFHLHDLAVEDALRAHQRPKVEEYGDALFVVLRTARVTDGDAVAFGETHLFVGKRYVVSVRHGDSMPYTTVRRRSESTPQLLRFGPGFVLYAIMDYIVDQYFPVVDAFEERLGELERLIFDGAVRRNVAREIYELKSELLEFKRTVAPLVEVCNRLLRFDLEIVPPEVRTYLRDVHDHVLRVNESVDTLRELLASALDANLALVGVAQNDIMKRLAGWAAILAMPTMIAGIYGMNFENMPELHASWGYPGVMLSMVVLCGVMYWRFRRAGWL
jgi:magnesium transporter